MQETLYFAMTEQLIHIKDLSFRPFITKEEIAQKVSELGQRISEDYKGERPLIIAILNGAFIFAADLMRAINIECEITFVKLASYEGTSSTGNVKTM
ncbi:MAG: phosphoribosyltransferase family protein, partial [Bacteroidota bacterium]